MKKRQTWRPAFELRVWKPLTSAKRASPTLDFPPFPPFGGMSWNVTDAELRSGVTHEAFGRNQGEARVPHLTRGNEVRSDVSLMRCLASKYDQQVRWTRRGEDAKER